MSNNSNIVYNALQQIAVGTATEIAEHADVSSSSAYKWLNQFVTLRAAFARPSLAALTATLLSTA